MALKKDLNWIFANLLIRNGYTIKIIIERPIMTVILYTPKPVKI